MNKFPVFQHIKVERYRLYPGTDDKPGLDFEFKTGLSLLAGINGLGKTTLITMLFRLIVGPFELPKDSNSAKFGSAAKANVVPWGPRNRYFSQRVADKAETAEATLKFLIGSTRFEVTRSLRNLKLTACFVDGAPIPCNSTETEYQAAICRASDAGQFVDFLTTVKYLTFFNEERRDILWDEQAQRQFFRILFTSPVEAGEWIRVEQEINSADSRARNLSASVYQLSQDLKSGEKSLIANSGMDARLNAEQALLDADLKRKDDLEAVAEGLEIELHSLRRDLERTKLAEDAARRVVEEVRFGRLSKLFPSLNDTAKYILTQLYSEGRCLACEQVSAETEVRMQEALGHGNCIVCGLPIEDLGAEGSEGEPENIEFAQGQLEAATTQRNALSEAESKLDQQWRDVLAELARLATAINDRNKNVQVLREKLPPDPEDLAQLRKSIAELREREATEKRRRVTAEAIYEKLLSDVNAKIELATSRVNTIFQQLIECFLEEKCSLSFKMIQARPSQSGRFFNYPSLRFEMTAAGFEGEQIRSSPDDVSESQREFIDLAFRMALAEASAHSGAASMVIETPEASLDAVFMTRAADMLKAFATGPRSVVVTSNLTNTAMIPALMGPATDDPKLIEERRSRVVDLLEIAAPNAALRLHKDNYVAVLDSGIRGLM